MIYRSKSSGGESDTRRAQREIEAEINGEQANEAENKGDPQSIDAAHDGASDRGKRIAASDEGAEREEPTERGPYRMKMLSGEEREMLERVAELGPSSEPRDATPAEDQLLFGLLLAGRIEALRSPLGGKRKPRVTTMGHQAIRVDRIVRTLASGAGK